MKRVRSLLEIHRVLDEKERATVRIQRHVRVWYARRHQDVIKIQRVFRGFQCRVLRERRREAGERIRRWIRNELKRSKANHAWRRLQAVFRGRFVRKTRKHAKHKIGRFVLTRWRKSRRCFETVESVRLCIDNSSSSFNTHTHTHTQTTGTMVRLSLG